MQLAGDMDHGSEGDAFERDRIPTPERIQVDAVTVIGSDHGQAGEAAFSGLCLMNDWQVAAALEIQQRGHDHILTLRSGSRSQLINERFSRIMSALRSMSACSNIFLP